MSDNRDKMHLTAERIQEYLDGTLPRGETLAVRDHVALCAPCQAEVEAWQFLFSELGELDHVEAPALLSDRVLGALPETADARLDVLLGSLGHHAPPEAFAARVMEALPAAESVAAREAEVEASLAGLGHYRPVEGFAARVMADWSARTVDQAALEAEVDGLMAGVGHFEPSPAFRHRVMAGLRVRPSAATLPDVRAALSPIAAFVGRFVPRTRKAWAAISGFAVTPVSVLAVMAWAVFSNPQATPSNLAAYAWWQVSGAVSALTEPLRASLSNSDLVMQAYGLLNALMSSPLIAAAGAVSFGVLTCGALWVLYKNLIPARTAEPSYVRVAA